MGDKPVNTVQGSEMRKNNRIEHYSKLYCTKYFLEGSEVELPQPIELILLNVSASGLGVLSQTELKVNSILVIDMTLEDVQYRNVNAKVMWSTKKGELYRYGLQLLRLSGRLYTHLSRLDNSVTAHV